MSYLSMVFLVVFYIAICYSVYRHVKELFKYVK